MMGVETAIERVGEVVATSIAEFEAQSTRLHETPPLGTLVRVRTDDGCRVYGIVTGAYTDGVDANVRPVPRGRDGCEDAAVYQANPDLVYVLRSCFQSLVVGYADGDAVRHFLPGSPVPIHYSVSRCAPAECVAFSRRLDYFRIVLAARLPTIDEVLAAHIRLLVVARQEAASGDEAPASFRIRAGREVATLLRAEHQRATTILQCIRPVAAG